MAKVVEQRVIVGVSQLVRNDGAPKRYIDEKAIATIDAALQEVLELPEGVVVEVTEIGTVEGD